MARRDRAATALLMNEHKIGGLVVIDQGRVAGMFTERDLLRLVADRRDPANVRRRRDDRRSRLLLADDSGE